MRGQVAVLVAAVALLAPAPAAAHLRTSRVAVDYRALIEQASAAREQPAGQRQRTLKRLRRELRRIRARDFFPPPEREHAQRALDELVALVEEPVG